MEALLPAAKFLIYAVGFYFLASLVVTLGVVGLVVVLAAMNERGRRF